MYKHDPLLHNYLAYINMLVLWWKYIIMFCIIIENKISSHDRSYEKKLSTNQQSTWSQYPICAVVSCVHQQFQFNSFLNCN